MNGKWKELMKKENLIVIILLGVLLFIIAIPVDQGKEEKTGAQSAGQPAALQEPEEARIQEEACSSYADYQEKRLSDTLSAIEHVGRVKVMVTVSATSKSVVEKDSNIVRSTTTETDSQGGARNINNVESSETTLYTKDEAGREVPYVVQVYEPEIMGVVVVAQGAGTGNVNSDISEAIQALFGIEAHKIKIVKMKTE